jgi:hypothetical protein
LVVQKEVQLAGLKADSKVVSRAGSMGQSMVGPRVDCWAALMEKQWADQMAEHWGDYLAESMALKMAVPRERTKAAWSVCSKVGLKAVA